MSKNKLQQRIRNTPPLQRYEKVIVTDEWSNEEADEAYWQSWLDMTDGDLAECGKAAAQMFQEPQRGFWKDGEWVSDPFDGIDLAVWDDKRGLVPA